MAAFVVGPERGSNAESVSEPLAPTLPPFHGRVIAGFGGHTRLLLSSPSRSTHFPFRKWKEIGYLDRWHSGHGGRGSARLVVHVHTPPVNHAPTVKGPLYDQLAR